MKAKLLGHSANDLFWFILPLVLPSLLVRYSLSYAEAGGILTIYLLVLAMFSFMMGKLSDRFSRKKILSLGFFLAALGLIASGFAPGLSVFLVLISITAVGVSTFHPVMYAVIHDTYSENRSRMMGLYECFGTGAIFVMFLVNGYLLESIGVRGVLILTAVPALIMGFVYVFSDSISNDRADLPSPDPTGVSGRGRVLRFMLFLFSVILRVFSVTAVLNFLPIIFVDFFGLDPGGAAYSTAFFFAGGIAGSLVFGSLSARYNSFGIILAGSVFIGGAMFVLSASLPVWIYLIIIALFGGFASGCVINQNLLMGRLGGSLGKGEVFGILMGVMTVTSAFSPAVFGTVIDTIGYQSALRLFVLPLILSSAILIYLLRTDKTRAGMVETST
ncbi:MAG: MFS transporter [Spirochaetales bacterium]|nr:MFS transporter [Spirochaetales bacterium]